MSEVDERKFDRKRLFCGECNQTFRNVYHFEQHLEIHFNIKTFKCNMCIKVFHLKVNLDRHLLAHNRIYECCQCKKSFKYESVLNQHIKTHGNDIGKHCRICGKIIEQKHCLEYHLRIHAELSKMYYCNYCLQKFTCMKYLNGHMLLHSEWSPFQCEICPDSFNNILDLNMHTPKHNNEILVECAYCRSDFEKFSNLTHYVSQTVASVNQSIEPNQLLTLPVNQQKEDVQVNHISHYDDSNEIPKKETEVKPSKSANLRKKVSSLVKNIPTHTEGTEYLDVISTESENCDQITSTETTNEEPKIFVQEKSEPNNHKVKCELCSNYFPQNSCLYYHLKLHALTCDIHFCNYCFNTYPVKDELHEHLDEQHSDQLPFQCELCIERYSTMNNLEVHYKQHANNKLYPCKLCLTNNERREKGTKMHFTIYNHEDAGKEITQNKKRVHVETSNSARNKKLLMDEANFVEIVPVKQEIYDE